MSAPHGVPTTGELVEAVREFLEREVMPAADARLRFLALVAANALSQCERELALGPAQAQAHAQRLAALGVADDAELVGAIRAGTLDDRIDEVVAATRAAVVDRLRIVNPKYLHPNEGSDPA